MFCSHCGAQIDDNSKFCIKCGKAIESKNNKINKTMIIAGIGFICVAALISIFAFNKNNTEPVQAIETMVVEENKIHNDRGIEYYDKHEYGNAIAEFTHAIEIKADYPEAYNGRGNTYRAMNDYDQAITDYKKALELKSDYAEAKENLQQTIRAKEELEAAGEKIYVFNVGHIPLGQTADPSYAKNSQYLVSPNDMSKYIGKVLDLTPNQYPNEPMRVRFEEGTVWFRHNSSEATIDTAGKVLRAVFTKPDIYTKSGIHIGDDIEMVFQKHGQPNRTLDPQKNKKYKEFVDDKKNIDTWMVYKLEKGGLPRIGFGIENDKVVAIALSVTPAGF